MHDDDVVGKAHDQPDVVLDQEHGDFRRQRADQRRGIFSIAVAHTLRGLVEHEDSRPGGERDRDPVVQRVLLLDAPSVLGWERWRDMDEQHALGMIRLALQHAADTGRLQPHLVSMFAHVVFASLNELALVIARADDVRSASADAEIAIDELISRLLPPP